MNHRYIRALVWVIVVALTVICLFLSVSYLWGLETIEFTNIDVVSRLNRILFDMMSVPEEEIRYVVVHPRWIALLSVGPLLVLPIVYSLSDFRLWQRILSGIVRFALLALIVFCLCDVERIEESNRVSTVVVVDESDSMTSSMRRAAESEVRAALRTRPDDVDLHVVAFSQFPRTIEVDAIGVEAAFLAAGSDEVADVSESLKTTDIASAMRYSYALFPEGAERRILLISDGNETSGSALSEAALARAQGIRIDVRRLAAPEIREVLISGDTVDDRSQLRVGQPFEIGVQIESTHETRAHLDFSVDGEVDAKQSRDIDLIAGMNEETFRVVPSKMGELTVKFALTGLQEGEDRFAENNAFTDKFEIQGKPKVLYVESNSFGAEYLQRALQGYGKSSGQDFEVEVRSATGMPTSMNELLKYSAVLLGDVPRTTDTGRTNVTSASMELLREYVHRHGGGFVAIGGENAFGPGGYSNTPIEKILPVDFKSSQRKQTSSMAIAYVIDKSGSMALDSKLSMAKEAVKASVGVLNAQDRVIVIGFDAVPTVVVPSTRAVNRTAIASRVSRMNASGETDIVSALDLAYLELSLLTAKTKHVILLSDGNSSTLGSDKLMREMARSGITVSTVALGDANTTYLSRVAKQGSGRSYVVRDVRSVPRIFVEETEQMMNRSIVEEPFVPRVARQHEMIKGVTLNTLMGYVTTRAKSGSQTVLTAPSGDPILAQWQYGTGKTTAFTSDAKNRWAAQWIRNSKSFAQFWGQVVRSTMKTDDERQFDMRIVRENARLRIMVDAVDANDAFLNGLDIVAQIEDPRGERFDVVLHQTAPGFYENAFALAYLGTYFAQATLMQSGETLGYAQETYSFPYAEEYVHTAPNSRLLAAIAETADGCVDCEYDAIFKPEREGIRDYFPIWPNYLWWAFLLIGIDVFLRRIRMAKSR